MKSILVILACILALATQSFALDKKPLPEHEILIKKISSQYETQASFSANFVQTSFVEMIGQKIHKNGRIQTDRPNKMRIEYETDPGKTYISNGTKLWVIDPKALKAREFKNPDQVIGREALSFLSGLNKIETLFDILPNAKQPKDALQITSKGLTILALVPRDEASEILRLTLGIDPKSLTVKEAVLFNASGNVTHYIFSNVKLGEKISESTFEFPKDKKIKIVKKGL